MTPSWATRKTRKMNGSWGMWSDVNKRNVERLNTAEKKGRLDFILYGDSISAFHYGYTITKRAPGSNVIWKKHFGDLNAIPLAIAGDQIGQVVWRLMQGHEKPKEDPKVIAFLIGVNDLTRFGEDKTKPRVPPTGDRMQYLLELIRTTMPTTGVIVCALTPTLNPDILRDRKNLNATYKSLVDKQAQKGMRIKFVDCSNSFSNADGTPKGQDYLTDTVHLTAKAHDIVLGNMREAARSLMTSTTSASSSSPSSGSLRWFDTLSTSTRVILGIGCLVLMCILFLSSVAMTLM